MSNMANQLNASIFVSIHNNASNLPSVSDRDLLRAPASEPELFAQRMQSLLPKAIQMNSFMLSRNDRGKGQFIGLKKYEDAFSVS